MLLRHPVSGARILLRFGGTLAGAVALAGRCRPSHIALVRAGASISCAELAVAVEREREGLAARHPAGTRIGVLSDDGIGTIALLAAAIGAGLDALPLGPRLGAADTEAVIRREGLAEVLWPVGTEQTSPSRDRGERGAPPSRTAHRAPGRLVLLTSGSTGLPKAQPRGRASLGMMRALLSLDRRLRWLHGPVLVLAPVDHGHGLSAVLSALLGGRTALLGAGLAPDALAADLALAPPASATGVPLQLARASDAGLLGGVRRIVSGSSRLDDALAARLTARTGASLIDCLGTTETGTFATREPPRPFRAVGGMRTRVDATGSIEVRSPFAGGWVRTGDTGRTVPGGLVVSGRGDDLVDASGELISPERVREAICSLPGVLGCEVEAFADELRGSIVVARVDVDDEVRSAPGTLRERLIPLLGRSGIPHRIEVTAVSR